MVSDDRILYTVRDVADAAQISESNARRLIAHGAIRSVRIGRCLRVSREALQEYVASLEGQQQVAAAAG